MGRRRVSYYPYQWVSIDILKSEGRPFKLEEIHAHGTQPINNNVSYKTGD